MPNRILLAEDNPGISRHLQDFIQKTGYECIAVTNGKEAFEAFKAQHFGLLMIDGSMPGMEGFEAIKKIRAFEGVGNRTPIILHSADQVKAVSDQCQLYEIDAFFPKVSDGHLMLVVWTLLGKNEEGRSHQP